MNQKNKNDVDVLIDNEVNELTAAIIFKINELAPRSFDFEIYSRMLFLADRILIKGVKTAPEKYQLIALYLKNFYENDHKN